MEMENCICCGHLFTKHVEGDFNACVEPECNCAAYWNSEDEALANAV